MTLLGDKDQYGLVFVYIKEEDAHAHAQNTPIEQFLSISGLGVVSRLLSEINLLPIRRRVNNTVLLHSYYEYNGASCLKNDLVMVMRR